MDHQFNNKYLANLFIFFRNKIGMYSFFKNTPLEGRFTVRGKQLEILCDQRFAFSGIDLWTSTGSLWTNTKDLPSCSTLDLEYNDLGPQDL